MKFLYLAVGGVLGTFLRYAISGWTYRFTDSTFPWGTLIVNLLGTFAVGFLWETFEHTTTSPYLKLFALAGVLGAFTTFSTFGLETFNLLRDGEIKWALMNVLLSNVVGMAMVFLGFATSRFLFSVVR